MYYSYAFVETPFNRHLLSNLIFTVTGYIVFYAGKISLSNSKMERQLSKNFTLGEMTFSETAVKHGVVNNPSDEDVKNLEHLCQNVLQPLRDYYGKPIRVTSGFRSKTLNRLVGGSKSSQHMRGEAADLHIPSIAVAMTWMHFIIHNCPFDQMLFEHNRHTGAAWLHVSCRADHSRNRRQIKSLHIR